MLVRNGSFWVMAVSAAFLAHGAAFADTLMLSGRNGSGSVLEDVTVLQRYPDGTIEVEVNGIQQTFTRDRYTVLTANDLLVLRDGRHFEGRVIDRTEFAVVFEAGGQRQEFPVAQVQQLVQLTDTQPGVATGPTPVDQSAPFLLRAEEEIRRGQFAAAGATLLDAAKAGADRTTNLPVLLGGLLEGTTTRAKELTGAGREEEAVRLVQDTRKVLDDPALATAAGAALVELNKKNLSSLEARAYVSFAQRILQSENAPMYNNALATLQLAEGIEPSVDSALLSAEVLSRLGRPADALPFLTRALPDVEAAPAGEDGSTLRQRFYRAQDRYLRSAEQIGQPGTVVLAPPATPTPEPAFVPVAAPPEIIVVATPTPAPPPPTGAEAVVDTYLKRPYAIAEEWSLKNTGLPAWALLAAIVGGWLVFFTLPNLAIRQMIKRGSYVAAQWQNWVKWGGLAAFLLAMLALLFDKLNLKWPGSKGKAKDKVLDHNIDNLPVYEIEDYINRLIRQLETAATSGQGISSGLSMGIAEKDLMQRLVRALVTLGIKRRASDIHIEPEIDGANVRMRLDGVMYDMVSAPRSISNALISAIKVMANLDIAQKRLAQDGKIAMWVDNSDVDIRVNTAPGSVAERVTMRLLDSRSIQVDSSRLGLEGRNVESFETLIRRPAGVIFLTGPTGSGKTTTLYVALNTLNTGEKNIITIEDPIEYQLKGISQMQVNDNAGFSFAMGLRSILRSDPDIIMVGEIRDKETADIAIDAASTGHLVFTTLHTIDAPTVMTRLLDLGVEPRRAASSMLAAIAQRLIRVSCPKCRKPYTPAPALIQQLGMLPQDLEKTTFIHGEGCDACVRTGFQGRMGLYEFFVPDEKLREMMESGTSINVIRENAKRRGMRTLREEGIARVMQGITTVEEVLRCT